MAREPVAAGHRPVHLFEGLVSEVFFGKVVAALLVDTGRVVGHTHRNVALIVLEMLVEVLEHQIANIPSIDQQT